MRGAALALFGILAVVYAEGDGEEEEEEEEVAWGGGGELDDSNFGEMINDEDWKPWAVLFSQGDATKDLAAVFSELAEKSTDMLSFGEVDTTTPEGAKLAAEHGWEKGATDKAIQVFSLPASGFGKREGKWLEVAADVNMKTLYADLTAELGDSLVTVIENKQDFQQFIQAHKRTLPKVFLFSKKTEPSALYKALSLEYEGRLDLSIIGDKDEELLTQFSVKEFPALMVMAGMKDNGNGEQQMQIQPYPGKSFQFKALNKFLKRFAGPSGGPSAQSLSTQSALEKACTPACLLVLVSGSESASVLKPLAKKTAGELVKPVVIDVAQHPDVTARLGVESTPAAVLLSALPGAGGDIQVSMKKDYDGEFTAEGLAAFMTAGETLILTTAQNGGTVAAGLQEIDELPVLWGEAGASGKKGKTAKAQKSASSTFNLTDTSFSSLVIGSDHVWLVLTCEGGPSGCPEEAAMWESVSKKLRGIIWCGTLDSAAKSGPGGKGASIFAYPHGKAKKRDIADGKTEPKLYKHDMEVSEIADWATDFLPKREEGVDAETFEVFVQKRYAAGQGQIAPTAVVFVDDEVEGGKEEDAVPLVRALAYQHKGMTFGMMQVKEAKKMKNMDFGQLFKRDPPHLLLMVLAPQKQPDGKEGMGLNFQPFMGKWEAEKVGKFLTMHDKENTFDDIGTDPDLYGNAEVIKITMETPPKVACGEARVCLIALLDTFDSFHADQMAILEAVSLHNTAKVAKGGEAVPITWIDSANQPAFVEAFGVASLPTVVVWSPETGDYGQLLGSYETGTINRLVDKAARFTKRALTMNVAQLPEVVEPMDPAAAAEEDDFDLSELMGDVMDAGDDAGDDDDDDDDMAGMTERGPARLKKKKGKKDKKKKKDKKDKKKKDKKK